MLLSDLRSDGKLQVEDEADMGSADGAIGVIGGGQLARMLTEAAALRGIDVLVQTSSEADCAVPASTRWVQALPTDQDATRDLARDCGGITFENEWVTVDALMPLERQGVTFVPSLASLVPLVNKLSQRRLLDDLSIPSPRWICLAEINPGSPALPPGWTFPVMAKAASGGYDGKGTRILENLNDLAHHLRNVRAQDWLLESWVNFERELALVVSRDRQGRIRHLPLVETHQSHQICDWVLAPAEAEPLLEATAYNIAASLLTRLGYVGVMALEFFYGQEGLFVNEIAPRTHNSGHFSIEACSSSQFDQQLCITAGLPVPSIELVVDGALMVNLLGLQDAAADGHDHNLQDRLARLRSIANAHVHWYGKQELPGRKVGHVTVVLREEHAETRRQMAMTALNQIREVWPNPLN